MANMVERLLVLAMQVFILTFALRETGFSGWQTVVLTVGITTAINLKH